MSKYTFYIYVQTDRGRALGEELIHLLILHIPETVQLPAWLR